ncbi:MAG: DUF1294 domain-containing protein [Negativicutes bacterium]
MITLYILWNLVGFFLVMLDKQRARQNAWRIRERTFFLAAFAFGAVGILIGMQIFRHKTRHWSFKVGIPLLCIFNIIIVYIFWQRGWLV